MLIGKDGVVELCNTFQQYLWNDEWDVFIFKWKKFGEHKKYITDERGKFDIFCVI